MIVPVLLLGGGRYLTSFGEVVTGRDIPADNVAVYQSIDPDYDPEADAAPGDPVRLTDENRARWAAIAREGGHDLADLIG